MEPLITIETVPISFEYVEKKQPKIPSATAAKLRIQRNQHTLSIKSDPISLHMDSFKSSSLRRSSNLTYTATAQYSTDGKLNLHVKLEGVKPDAIQCQQFDRGIDHMVDYLQSDGNYFPGMDISFDISHLQSGLTAAEQLDTSFMPPDLELKVVEWPKVIIKYIGGPIYIPKSADPDYEPPQDLNLPGTGSQLDETV
ncbi:MAG: hypothetical protein ACOX5F_08535 [Anaerovoracaceae bacterium]|jgi:hypothetical protein